jgi:hypothetical protein
MGVGSLNKNFEGQVLSDSEFNFEGVAWYIAMFLLLHFQFGAPKTGLGLEHLSFTNHPQMQPSKTEGKSPHRCH